MRTLTEFNRGRVGLMGVTVLALVVAVGQSFTSVPMLFASPSYYAQFTDTGQLNKNDKVRISGVNVGTVQALDIEGDHVVIKFAIGSNTIGTESRLAIKTDTLLGKKVLEIEPRGTRELPPGGVLPLGQSTTPYQLYDANFDIVKAAAGWDIGTVKRSLNVLSQTIDQTYPHLSAALDGLTKFSDTIGKRDEEIKHLLAQANQVASVLGDRSEQINRLLVNAKTLLAAFNERGRAIDALLQNISAFSAQVQGFINDNPNLNPVLEQLRAISDVLAARKDDLAQTLTYVSQFAASLGNPSHRDPTSRSSCPICCRIGSCSRSSTPPSRSAVSTRRTSGAAPACPNSAGPTPTAPGSPTARRRPHLQRWKAPRIIRDRPSHRAQRVRTPRRLTRCRGRGTRCRARA